MIDGWRRHGDTISEHVWRDDAHRCVVCVGAGPQSVVRISFSPPQIVLRGARGCARVCVARRVLMHVSVCSVDSLSLVSVFEIQSIGHGGAV